MSSILFVVVAVAKVADEKLTNMKLVMKKADNRLTKVKIEAPKIRDLKKTNKIKVLRIK